MKKTGLVILVLLVLSLIFGAFFVSGYNKAARMEEKVMKAWGNVENVLQRRYDLIPNLVETVKGYAAHEEQIFTDLAEARLGYFGAQSPAAKVEAQAGVESALSRLLAIVENYPELKANESFLKLQDELAGTENRISVERNRYNSEVEVFRSYARSLLGGFFIRVRSIDWQSYQYFKSAAEAARPVEVNFRD